MLTMLDRDHGGRYHFDHWREIICRQLIGVEMQTDPATFRGRFEQRRIGNVCVAEVSASDVQVYRSDAMLCSEGCSDILINLLMEGCARSIQAGNTCLVGAGDIFIQTGALPYSLEFSANNFRVMTLRVPRERFMLHATLLDALCSVPLKHAGKTSALAVSLLSSLHDNLADIEDDDAELAIGVALTIVGLACARLAPSPRSSLHASYQRISRLIDQRLADPDLTPASIAALAGITPRQLSRIFEGEHETVSQAILRRRLERCRLDLLSRGLAGRSIGEIAFSWGFNNQSHFSASFRAAYGVSARDLRRSR